MITSRFFKTENVELDLEVPVEQAINNLGASVTAPGKLPPGFDSWMVGSVTQSTTHIHRAVAGSRNSFRPTFYGSFTSSGQQSKLIGEITLNRVIQKFIVLWCSIVALMAIWTFVTVLQNPAASWGSLAYIVFMLLACIAFFSLMIKKTSADATWLKQEITRSANGR